MKIKFIGDVHGKLDVYRERIKGDIPSIQVGDFGFKKEHDKYQRRFDTDKHKILFGNHDYYPYLHKDYSLGDFGEWNGVFTIRGAYSIDQHIRKEGYDWFRNEELDYATSLQCLDVYSRMRPSVVATHDCPHRVRMQLFDIYHKSSTTNLLQACFEEHQPKLWVFGHHHESIDIVINGTRFVCLAECEAKVFEI